MGSATVKLPVIVLSKSSDLAPGTAYWSSIRSQVWEALQEYGCFEAFYDEVSPQLHRRFISSTKDFFDLPMETKLLNTSDIPFYGYVPHSSTREGMSLEEAEEPRSVQNLARRMWPESGGNPSFCESMCSFSKILGELEQMVERMVFESLCLDKDYLGKHLESLTYHLRFFKYGGPQKDEAVVNLPPHKDHSFMSVLHQNEDVSGLELQTRDGTWIEWKPSPTSFIVLCGYPMAAWSNGRVHAPPHRVIMKGEEIRYSLILFSYVKGMIETPQELINENHPPTSKPFDHLEHLHHYLTTSYEKAKAMKVAASAKTASN